ncbi:hypothetical protein [Sandaracinobacteroides hominis]|uniref:hypothetical protein n=1 Tax=Sandaracinobacteroides hominis TaxID=2780086 RepID=UPI0018F5A849|nr:hypothetical protein [Sandaracinobacteroides hominis]
MRQDVLARFAVIDRYDNELDAKIAETVYAQLMLQAGYRLYNLWPSQSLLLTVNQLDRAIAGIRRRAGTGSVSRKMSEQQANQAVTAKERSRRQTEARD